MKCQERASQFSRDTGSEEVDINPVNNDEDELFDDNHIYTTKDIYNRVNNVSSPPTTGKQKMFSLTSAHLFFQIFIQCTMSLNLL